VSSPSYLVTPSKTNLRSWALRQQLSVLTPLEALRNKRFLSSGAVSQRLHDLHTELILIVEDLLPLDTGAATTAGELWKALQYRKAVALHETISIYTTPGYLLAEIQRKPQALALYNVEQELIQQVRHAHGTMELYKRQRELSHHQLVIMNTEPILKSLVEKRLCLGATMSDLDCMAVLAQPHFGRKNNLIFVDWLRYHDFFFILGYNATSKSLVLYDMIRKFNVRDAHEWVMENILKPQRKNPAEAPMIYNPPLAKLLSLVKPIHKFVKPGDILVFSPTGILNSIPLHAIPFESEDDYPVIYHNPVIYSSSNAVMRDCVDRAVQLCASSSPWKGAFYGDLRMPTTHPMEDASVRRSVEALSARFGDGTAVAVTGSKLNRKTFKEHLSDSTLVHFHGHTGGGTINRGLKMEPLAIEDIKNSDYYRQLWYESGCRSRDTGLFTVQDIFLANLNAPLVTLMACSSSEQDVGQSDDPIGLISALLTAGASSVIGMRRSLRLYIQVRLTFVHTGTLWPTDSSDGRAFSEIFYQEAFLAKPAPISNLALAMQKTVLKLRADGDEEHPRPPFHWAQFVLRNTFPLFGVQIVDVFE